MLAAKYVLRIEFSIANAVVVKKIVGDDISVWGNWGVIKNIIYKLGHNLKPGHKSSPKGSPRKL